MNKRIFLYLIIFSVLAAAVYSNFNYTFDKSEYLEVNVLEQVEEDTLIIGNNCTAIVAKVSNEKIQSILLGIDGKIDKRPNGHDTTVAILNSYNITVEGVFIDSRDEDFYYSDIVLNNGKKILKLDAMPSDAIAIALRVDAPIYINSTLLETDGIDLCEN